MNSTHTEGQCVIVHTPLPSFLVYLQVLHHGLEEGTTVIPDQPCLLASGIPTYYSKIAWKAYNFLLKELLTLGSCTMQGC